MMDMNLDLASRNVFLEHELELARKDALLLRKEALLEKKANFNVEMSKAQWSRNP